MSYYRGGIHYNDRDRYKSCGSVRIDGGESAPIPIVLLLPVRELLPIDDDDLPSNLDDSLNSEFEESPRLLADWWISMVVG
jgi:hypothetical protein